MRASARTYGSNSAKLPASFAIERSAKGEGGSADEMPRKPAKERRERKKERRKRERDEPCERGRKEWGRRSRGDIRLGGQGLCLRVISCKNPINFLNPPPVAKGVANKRAYKDEGGCRDALGNVGNLGNAPQ